MYKYIKNISILDLSQEILNKNKTIILDFYANWYKPSKSSLDILESIGEMYKDKLTIYKVNFEKFRDISEEFEINSLPTLIFIRNEVEVYRVSGTFSKEQIGIVISSINNF